MKEGKKGITGSTLKWIAIITMLTDHIGATVLTKQILYNYAAAGLGGGIEQDGLYYVMYLTRQIGRIAFPIFCFLLVEGFQRTRNIKKYILRMFLFALLSEIPFDLAFTGKIFYAEYQNVMFTMLLGLLTMEGCYLLEQHIPNRFLCLSGCAACTVLGMLAAEALKTDYAAKGIFAIMVLYFLRRDRLRQMISGAISFLWEIPAPLAYLFIWKYNNKRGRKMKWFFYLFYPLHLFLLYLLCLILGLAHISVL